MQVLRAQMMVFIAMVLALHHARCAAACIAHPCNQERPASCHHHKTPETKADRGCAFPAASQERARVQGRGASATAEAITLETGVPRMAPAVDAPWDEWLSGANSSGGPPLTILRI